MPDPPDSPTRPKRRRPRQPLTLERVLRKACELADAEGVEGLSMRKLARALGVEAMSLYHHVENKEGLLDGLVEEVAAELEPPRSGAPWRAAMHRRATAAHAMLHRHPWAAALLMSRVNVGPRMLAYADATIGCLRDAGFSWVLADHAWNLIDSHVYGFTVQQLAFPFEPDEYAARAAEFLPMIPSAQFPHLYGMAREVIEGRHDGLHSFEFGLELILDGIERLLDRETEGR